MEKLFRITIFLTLLLGFIGCSGSSSEEPPTPTPEPEPPIEDLKHYISSLDEFLALDNLGGGDTVVWKKGSYSDQEIVIKQSGKSSRPFVFMAEEDGKTILTGSSKLVVEGSYVVIKGFWFKDPISTRGKAIITLDKNTSNCRVSECAISGENIEEDKDTDYKWISLFGTKHRVEKCSFTDKKNIGTLFVVWLAEGVAPQHKIVSNYFTRPLSFYDEEGNQMNGQETLRIGTSDYSLQPADCIVENNWFFRCDGETEVISNKSGGNIYRGNLFEESQGTLTLRHGNDCLVEKNYFIGNSVANTGGIRVIGENHVVKENFLSGLRGSGYKTGICLVRGEKNPPLTGYTQVKECYVTDNVLVNCRYALHLNYGARSSQVQPVISTTIENNIIVTDDSKDYTVYLYDKPVSEIIWTNNSLFGGRQVGTAIPQAGKKPTIPSAAKAVDNIKKGAGAAWFQ